jgi:hypothetical protein
MVPVIAPFSISLHSGLAFIVPRVFQVKTVSSVGNSSVSRNPTGSELTAEARRTQRKDRSSSKKYSELCELCVLCGEISRLRCCVSFLPGAAVIESD